ncbi:MAG: TlpA family protein disulfide reductase [Bacteroidales bacterium]|nr:TlpA family protein disulfide reductase [Bacteroidales bacterium]
MKTRLIVLIALMSLFGACKNEKKEAQTILNGILPDLKNETITLVPVQDYFPGLTMVGTYPTVKTDSLGKYLFRFTTTNSCFYQIINNNYHQLRADIYLEPGDSLFVDQSSWRDKPKFLIDGKGSDKLKHLEKDCLIFPKNKSFYDKIRSDYFSTELDFKRFIDSIHFERVDALTSFKDIPDLLRNHHLNTLNAERAQLLLEHLERRNYYIKQKPDYYYPDESYVGFLDSINFDNDFSKTTASKLLTNSYLNYLARQAFKSKTDKEWWEESLSWKLKFVSAQPKSLWTDLLALSTIRDYSFGLMRDDFFIDLETFDNAFKDKFFNSQNKNLFKVNITSYKNLAPGKPATDFALPDSSGNMHRLSDFKGNVVYIDFWGTWCYPCIQEIPDALVLQQRYAKDEPVTFLYVALEYDSTDIAGWKEFISGNDSRFGKLLHHKPFPGVHLVAEKQFRNEAISAYKLNSAPTHVLIDQNGNIVKARAKRSNEIREDIDELLKTIKKK